MILRPFLHADPVALSYVVGCGGHAVAAVVDPLGDITPLLARRQRDGNVPPAPPRAAQIRAVNSGMMAAAE